MTPFKTKRSQNEIEIELAELRSESEALTKRLLEIRKLRSAARLDLHEHVISMAADMNCECDSNYCHTERSNEVIDAGELDSFCHDDQDRGTVSVFCVEGEVEVIISTAVWSTYEEYDRKTLRTGESWKRDITSQSSWYDQTNRIEIVGKVKSKYNLDFSSWDD